MRLLLAPVLLAVPVPLAAAPVTYACTFDQGDVFGVWERYNQIVIDTDAQQIELREAQTMGTGMELVLTLGNDEAGSLVLQAIPEQGYLGGHGFEGPAGFGVSMFNGTFSLAMSGFLEPLAISWTCQK